FLSQNEIDAATMMRAEEFNPQMQTRIAFPDSAIVAKAYADQLGRSRALPAERVRVLETALDLVTKLGPGSKDRQAPLDRSQQVAEELERTTGNANGTDAVRMRALSAMLKRQLVKLR